MNEQSENLGQRPKSKQLTMKPFQRSWNMGSQNSKCMEGLSCEKIAGNISIAVNKLSFKN